MGKLGRRVGFAAALALASVAAPAAADLSAFVAAVGFDEEASLDGGVGAGLRWGKSSGIIGGETSLLVARPDRKFERSTESATAIFYEGRFLVNIPAGSIKPFVGVGFGAITITSTDLEVPGDRDEATQKAVEALSDLQTNSALSYGGGVRYGLNERLDARADLRQYLVFSAKSLVAARAAEELGEYRPKDKTVQYNELSAGLVFRF